MKISRRLVVVLALVTVTATTGAILRLLKSHRPTIDREHFEQIKTGMLPEQIDGILGGPPGDYSTRATSLDNDGIVDRKTFSRGSQDRRVVQG